MNVAIETTTAISQGFTAGAEDFSSGNCASEGDAATAVMRNSIDPNNIERTGSLQGVEPMR
jgi:hypothetical protein